MKIALSSDEYCDLVEALQLACQKRGHIVFYHGPRKGDPAADWPVVTSAAVQQVQRGEADEGIVLCYTGTGASMAANKHRGIRAALCVDPETAKGARIWNHANVLALSTRLITPDRGREILEAWLTTEKSTDEWNNLQIQRLTEWEER